MGWARAHALKLADTDTDAIDTCVIEKMRYGRGRHGSALKIIFQPMRREHTDCTGQKIEVSRALDCGNKQEIRCTLLIQTA